MANRIKIRHGNSIPTTSSLLPYELGWNTANKILYINDNNNAIEGIGLRYINTTDSTTWTADTLGATTSIAFTRTNITGAYTTGHIVWLNANDIGTPFQLVVHDSSELYFWKRWKSSGTWTSWTKMNAGYADSAGSANALNFVHTNELILGNNTSQSQIWLNYRRVQNGAASGNTAITEYRFCNGNGGTTGVTLYADSFTGAAAYLTTPNTAGFKTDQYGNFQHQRTTTTDYWAIQSNAGTEKFKVNFETGDTNVNGLIKTTLNSNTVTIGSQNVSFCHIYNSASIPFIFNNSVLTTGGNLGNSTYPFDNLTLGRSNGAGIYYKGTQNTYRMIRFIDNTSDVYGNGISIGGGGQTIIGGGESADALVGQAGTAGAEVMWICNDGDIDFFPGQQNGYDATQKMTLNTSGNLLLHNGANAVIASSNSTARKIFVAPAGTTTPPSGAVNGDIVLVKA